MWGRWQLCVGTRLRAFKSRSSRAWESCRPSVGREDTVHPRHLAARPAALFVRPHRSCSKWESCPRIVRELKNERTNHWPMLPNGTRDLMTRVKVANGQCDTRDRGTKLFTITTIVRSYYCVHSPYALMPPLSLSLPFVVLDCIHRTIIRLRRGRVYDHHHHQCQISTVTTVIPSLHSLVSLCTCPLNRTWGTLSPLTSLTYTNTCAFFPLMSLHRSTVAVTLTDNSKLWSPGNFAANANSKLKKNEWRWSPHWHGTKEYVYVWESVSALGRN